MENLQYPIGKFSPTPFSDTALVSAIQDIEQLPESLENALLNLDEAQLHTPYREGGWTVHQLVHHIADSHMNAFIRTKWALTETNPTLKAYDENAWSTLPDVELVPVNVSVTLLFALHKRWSVLYKSLTAEQWNLTIHHPVSGRDMSIWFLLSLYSWHGKHHVAHITSLRNRNNW
ncbi:MAG: putative metal-dependent hydrolase [Chitinophagia bacterium]|nr:putative metal-dependent hydrolase [Chitinophagia bacterium]